MNKTPEKEAFCYTEEGIVNENLKNVPKPDVFFPAGSLIPGTGCFFPGTDILVPGTGAFKQRKTGKITVASGFYLTEKGTYRIGSVYRHWPEQSILKIILPTQSTEAWNNRIAPLLKEKKKKVKRKRYQKRFQRIKQKVMPRLLKKKEIRIIKQTLDDSEKYKIDSFTQKRHAETKLRQFQKEAKKQAKKQLEKVKNKHGAWFAKFKQGVIDSINARLVVKYKRSIRKNIINEALAIAFATPIETVEEIRKNRAKTRTMIKANLLWQRGRRRQPAQRKPYTELRPVFEFDGLGLSGRTVFRRVVVENPYGGYARSGDPIHKVSTVTNAEANGQCHTMTTRPSEARKGQ